jgi:hypothetical protein
LLKRATGKYTAAQCCGLAASHPQLQIRIRVHQIPAVLETGWPDVVVAIAVEGAECEAGNFRNLANGQ